MNVSACVCMYLSVRVYVCVRVRSVGLKRLEVLSFFLHPYSYCFGLPVSAYMSVSACVCAFVCMYV